MSSISESSFQTPALTFSKLHMDW